MLLKNETKGNPTMKAVRRDCESPHRRQRALKAGESPYRALLETMELTNTKLTLQLINDKNKVGDDQEEFPDPILLQFDSFRPLCVGPPGAAAARALPSPGKHDEGED